MIASHSIRSVAKEINAMSENLDFISVNVIGKQSTGKTELIRTLSHLIHTYSKFSFSIKFLGRDDFRNLEQTITNLPPTDVILVFDDLAFLTDKANKKEMDGLSYILSVARHLPNRKDVRVIIFKSFQYSKAIPPFLRQNDATFFSSVDDNEVKNYYELLGKKYIQKIQLLKEICSQVKRKEDFTFPLGIHGLKFKYKTKQPFMPFLYYNGDSLRFCVSPLREFFDPICQTCEPSEKNEETKANLTEMLADFKLKHGGKANAKSAVRVLLLKHGINTYSSPVVRAGKYLDQLFEKKLINFEELALAFDLSIVRTSLLPSKQPEINKMIEVKP